MLGEAEDGLKQQKNLKALLHSSRCNQTMFNNFHVIVSNKLVIEHRWREGDARSPQNWLYDCERG